MSVTPERIAEYEEAREFLAAVRKLIEPMAAGNYGAIKPLLTRFDGAEKLLRETLVKDDALTAAQAENTRLRDALAAETEALEIALKAVADTHAYWDADQDSKVGKTLIALLDPTLRYRADISRMHAIRARKAAP